MKTIFVSSTFKDMQVERDAIRDIVSPLINQKALSHGDRIDFCDLRWGVNTEDLDNNEGAKKVLDVCFREIDRSQPPMIIILGDRYGWIPDKHIIMETISLKQFELEDLEKSITALEIEYGAFFHRRKALVYFRDIIGEDATGLYLAEDEEAEKKLSELKQSLKKLTNTEVKTYQVHLREGSFDKGDIEAFSHQVVRDLEALLTPEWEDYDKLSPFEREMKLQWNYIEDKSRVFSARESDYEICTEKIFNSDEAVILCKGAVGSGKSTLFSKIINNCEFKGLDVLPFVGGLTNQSNDALDILKNAVYYIESKLNLSHIAPYEDGKAETQDKRAMLQSRLIELARIMEEKGEKLLIAVDALDQLYPDENRDRLIFIPSDLPKSIRFFLTSTDDFETDYRPYHILSPLTEEDKRRLISGLTEHRGKELPSEVVESIVKTSASDRPLHISFLVTRLLIMNAEDFHLINQAKEDANTAIAKRQMEILDSCPLEIESLSVKVFREVGKRINPALTDTVCELIALSRYGLRLGDLASLCSDSWNQLDFARFINFLEVHFQIRSDGRYDFFHKSIREGFRNEIEKRGDTSIIHAKVRDYMEGLNENDPIRKREWIYHIMASDNKEEFLKFMIDYALSNQFVYIRNAAAICREISLSDNGQWVIAALEYADEEEYYTEVLWFMSKHLSSSFSHTERDLVILYKLMKACEAVLTKNEAKMPHQNRMLFTTLIYYELSRISHSLGNREEAYNYAELFLQAKKEELDWKNKVEDRVQLYHTYYHVISVMKFYNKPNALLHALDIAQEGLDMMDKASMDAYMKQGQLLPYLDCMGEMYNSLGNRDMSLKTYERGLKHREDFYKHHPTPYHLLELSGAYFNIAMTELFYQSYPHILRSYEFIKKSIDMQEELGDILKFFKEHREEFTEGLVLQQLSFCGRTYDLGGMICQKVLEGEKASEEIRLNALTYFHKALDLHLYVYNATGLSYDEDLLDSTLNHFRNAVRFKSREEYENYLKIQKKILDTEIIILQESPLKVHYQVFTSLVISLAEALINSSFENHLSSSLELIIGYGKKASEIAKNREQRDLFRESYKPAFGPIVKALNTGNTVLNEHFIKDYVWAFLSFYGGVDEARDENELSYLGGMYSMIGNYYNLHQSNLYFAIQALNCYERVIAITQRLLDLNDNIHYKSNLFQSYYTCGLVAQAIDKNNPLWIRYLQKALKIASNIGYDKLDMETISLTNKIEKKLTNRTPGVTPDNSFLIELIEQSEQENLDTDYTAKVLLTLARSELFALTLTNKSHSASSSSDVTSYFCLRTNDNKPIFLLYTDLLSALRFSSQQEEAGHFQYSKMAFSATYKIMLEDENFKGVMVRAQFNEVFIPLEWIKNLEEHLFKTEKHSASQKNPVNTKKNEFHAYINDIAIAKLKKELNYQKLKLAAEAASLIDNALNSYGQGIQVEDILAIDETGTRGFFKKKCEGIIFGKSFICSSHFPQEAKILYYDSISSLRQYGDELEIKLKDGKSFRASFKASNQYVAAALKEILSLINRMNL